MAAGLTPLGRRLFLGLIVAQGAHSVEECVFRLYDVLAPARWVGGLFSSDVALGFAVANVIIVLLGLWCYLARVRAAHPAARAWAWFWAVLEMANGVVHLAFAAGSGGYFPGAATAPLLLGLSLFLAISLWRAKGYPPGGADPTPRTGPGTGKEIA